MAFYDSVKDDVRDEHGDTTENTEDTEEEDMAFDQLKKDADTYKQGETQDEQQTETAPQQDQNDTDIEVLSSDEQEQAGPAQPTGSQDEVLSVLKRIEQQNEAMLDVLRGIKRSLDTAP